MPAISAVLIVKDEEARLRECLMSLRGAADEIVVADTGSSDRSPDIARDFTDRVVHFEWVDDFAAARNFALEHASGDYVLSIDADERIINPEEAGRVLQSFLSEHDTEVVGTVEILNTTGIGAEAQEVVDHTERFFRRVGFRFLGAIHEQIVPVEGCKRSASTGVRLLHSGYAQAHDAPDHKAHRNIRILERELEAHPDDEYYRYQLGKAYFSLKQYREAIQALEAALDAVRFAAGAPPMGRLGPVAREVLTGLVVTLAYAYVNTGQTAKAAQFLAEHAALAHAGTRRADFHHARGYVYLMLGGVAQSRAAYLESMRLGAAAEDVRGTGSFSSAYHLGLLSEAEQKLPEALEHYLLALRLKPDHEVTLSRCIDLITEHRVALPAELWATCGQGAFARLYLERIHRRLQQGDMHHAAVLVQVAGTLSPELLERCKSSLQAFLEDAQETPAYEEERES